MTVQQAREAARQWMLAASRIAGVRGAYTGGSTNWLPDNSELTATSDLDIMLVVADPNRAGRRRKFIYRDTLLEVSCLASHQLQSSDEVLSDYHLAPSFHTAKVIVDPFGQLTPLRAAVCRNYAKRCWVRRRCARATDKVSVYLRSVSQQAALPDQVIACLFAAGITSHILLVAGLKNPTVRARYVATRELLAGYGYLEFHDTLLELPGSARISRERARHHLAALTRIFDATTRAIKTRFSFESDLSESARPIAIDASLELIESGYHREAMFWIAVTHSRCQKVLSRDGPADLAQSFKQSYQELVADLGLSTFAEVGRRCAAIDEMLLRIRELADIIMAANHEIEDD
jgi:hypothetical protein